MKTNKIIRNILNAIMLLVLAFLVFKMGFVSGSNDVIKNSMLSVSDNVITIDYNGNCYEHIIY